MPSWFELDHFHCGKMMEAIRLAPHVPSRVRDMNIFIPKTSNRTAVYLEYKDGVISLVQTATRNSRQGKQVAVGDRHLYSINIPHFPQYFTVTPDELPDLRAFGTENGEVSVASVVSEYLEQAQSNFDLTEENLLLGALRGLVKDADGSTILDLFSFYGLTQDAVDIDFTAPDNIADKCNEMTRTIQQNLGAAGAISRVHALCGDEYFDAITSADETKEAYNRWNDGQMLRESYVYRTFFYKGVMFENYKGFYGSSNLIDSGEAIIFPVGPQIYRLYKGPADTMASVGRAGNDVEITSELLPHDGGIEYRLQRNIMPIVTRPKALLSSTATV